MPVGRGCLLADGAVLEVCCWTGALLMEKREKRACSQAFLGAWATANKAHPEESRSRSMRRRRRKERWGCRAGCRLVLVAVRGGVGQRMWENSTGWSVDCGSTAAAARTGHGAASRRRRATGRM